MLVASITTLFLLAILVGLVLLQIYLSTRENRWLGLILPALGLLWAILLTAEQVSAGGFSTGGVFYNLFPMLVYTLIYVICRERKRKKERKELDQMNIQDLD